jgi:arylsulfatase A-like enzyme
VAVAVVLGLAVACGREPAPNVVTFVPVARLIDLLRWSYATDRGVDVTLGRDTRRALALPAATIALVELDGEGRSAHYKVTALPDVARRWRRVRLLRKADVRGTKVDVPALTTAAGGELPELPLIPFETPQPRMGISVVAAPRKPFFSVETVPFTVPAGAELRFDAGVHAPGVRARLAVGASVSVLDGDRHRRIWRRNLEGIDATWHPQRLSLAAFAGRTIRLRFMTGPGRALEYGMIAAFGEPVVVVPRARPVHPFDVVLISMDTLRARSVGAYGAERPTSPTLDALGADGVLFENAFSSAAFTLPGHMSMLTGLWFSSHRAITAMSFLSPAHRTLAEALQAGGYATAAFSSGAWIMPWTGFRRGFDAYYEMPPSLYGADKPAGTPYDAFTQGLEWLRDHADRPCFVFLHNYVVHTPYTPPKLYKQAFDPLPPGSPNEEVQRRAYEQEVRYADDQIRAFLEGLDALGRADRTLVIVTADHGEQFGEHGGLEHTYDVHDEVAHVPLVMRLPGAIPAGREIAEPVSLVDLAPTIVDLLGLPPMHGVDGTSLLPLVAGSTDRLARDGVMTEAMSEANLGWVDLTAIRTRASSCIHDARRATYECFDRRVDPWEKHALGAEDPSPDARAARDAIARFRAANPPPDVSAQTVDDVPFTPDAAPSPDITEERRRQLRSLGYAE